VPAERFELDPIGTVSSPLGNPAQAPCQGDEGAPRATIVLEARFLDALGGVEAGEELLVLTWLDRAGRDVLRVQPRGDSARPAQGVFATRSPARPNPIGLHRVRVAAIDGTRLEVDDLEAVDGTPVLDLKPVLSEEVGER
jgi:tRNA-Thr(GGU) m(6)t(6)A37 methyltransferase TsaA